MKGKTFKKMSGALLVCMMVTSVSMPVNAQEPVDVNRLTAETVKASEIGRTTVLQETGNVKGDLTHQVYTFSYQTALPAEYGGGSCFKTEFTKGFNISAVEPGNWSNYDGDITVDIYSENTLLDTKTVAERESADMTAYQNVTKLIFRTENSNDNTVKNIDGIKITGTIDSNAADETVKAVGSYIGFAAAEDTAGITFSEGEVSTDCKYFAPGKPLITLSANTVSYQQSLEAVINGITGAGNTECRSYSVTIHVPRRMHITKVVMPEFDNADCRLYIGDSEQTVSNGEVVLDSAAENLTLKITPNSKEFVQTGDMIISMINSVNSNDTEYITVNVAAETVNGSVISDAAEKSEIVFAEQEIPVDPDPEEPDNPGPTDPEEPEEPEEPDIPDVPKPVEPSVPPKDEPSVPETIIPPVNNVIDYTGLNIQSAVAAASGSAVFDFTTGNSSSQSSSAQTYDFSLYDSVVDDNVTSATDDENSADKKSSLTEDIEAENKKKTGKDDSDNLTNNRFVKIAAISGGIIILGGGIVYLIFRPKKQKENSANSDE